MSGLPAWQERTLRHIARCTCCGTWQVISDAELALREADLLPPLDVCEHLEDYLGRDVTA